MKSAKIVFFALALAPSVSAAGAKEAYVGHSSEAATFYESMNIERFVLLPDHAIREDPISSSSHVGSIPRSPDPPVNFED